MSHDAQHGRIRQFAPAELLGVLNEVEAQNAPSQLYVMGNVDLLRTGGRVSVVGSRRPTPEGKERAARYAEALVNHDVVVVSGLAEGVDRVAHAHTINLGGHTVAVLGSGLDRPFPTSNKDVFARIVRDHVAISQFAPGTPPRRTNFPMRNRVMALVTDATIIVEAGETSGTRHQGWEALRLGRALFLDCGIAERGLSWAEDMIGYGAQVIEPEDISVLLEELPQVSSGAAELSF